MRGTVRTPNDDEIGAETKKQKNQVLEQTCNVDDRDTESKLVDNDLTFSVTSNQHPRETRQGLKIHQRDNMKYFIDVEATNSAAVLSTLVARNIAKKTPTEGLCHVVQWHLTQRDKTSKLH